MNKALTNEQFVIEVVGTTPYYEWNGVAGYSTVPYVKGTNAELPVSYWSGDACNAIPDKGDVPAGDVLGFISELPVGATIVFPKYYGCNYEGQNIWQFSEGGWDLVHSERSTS